MKHTPGEGVGYIPLVDGLAGEAKAAETVEDGGLEAADLGERRVDVKRAGMVSEVQIATFKDTHL